jgi:hypothetical protein
MNVGINELIPDTKLHVSRMLSESNVGNGLHLEQCSGAVVEQCVVRGNSGFGIYCGPTFRNGRIDGNACPENSDGIVVEGTGNMVVRNSATLGPLGGIFVAMPGNTVGPLIDQTTIGTNCNPMANTVH